MEKGNAGGGRREGTRGEHREGTRGEVREGTRGEDREWEQGMMVESGNEGRAERGNAGRLGARSHSEQRREIGDGEKSHRKSFGNPLCRDLPAMATRDLCLLLPARVCASLTRTQVHHITQSL